MKVRMVGHISGSRDGVMWPKPGEEIELPDDEAENLIWNKLAEAAEAEEEQADEKADEVPDRNKAIGAEEQAVANAADVEKAVAPKRAPRSRAKAAEESK